MDDLAPFMQPKKKFQAHIEFTLCHIHRAPFMPPTRVEDDLSWALKRFGALERRDLMEKSLKELHIF